MSIQNTLSPGDNLNKDPSFNPLLATPLLPKAKSDVYTTPPGHLARSNTSAGAKKKLSQVATMPNRCLVTMSERPIQVCHVLAKATDACLLLRLERAWGVELGSVNLNTTRNLIYLSADMHIMFDRNDWALVPTLEWLKLAAVKMAINKPVLFKDHAMRPDFQYKLVPLTDFPRAFLRFNTSAGPEISTFPFEELPNLTPIQ